MEDRVSRKNCPSCGEPVEDGWRICPVCEADLRGLACPKCGKAVRENWKRCPYCETALFCSTCNKRIPAGHERCPECRPTEPEAILIEPVTELVFIRIPGGTFSMGDVFGDGLENERPVHSVKLAPFCLSVCPVAQRAWGRVMDRNPSRFVGDDLPVESVSWFDAQEFLTRLQEKSPLKARFNLPTEAQWEYAARSGGRPERHAGGDDLDLLGWYADNCDGKPQPVGKKRPNGLGLHDMSGNVWEWCADVFRDDAYSRHAAEDPVETRSGEERVLRGGAFHLDAWSARTMRRFSLNPEFCGPAVGFRVALQPE
ncbi:SUMF1/EgtB/PvdO family nonheme iron enzyme [Desulfatirhabdium butyrativorans]|uniref:SUMF1/EgtB/PvdO family nonheme iron enzyme n=1 Tax=Desulfatirhabdium butyrativorans TaxID=340467 RepID=UPI000419E372|nr:SUMF1/EgtB/PvdO family nonheme iron enzyme [Desulfatirhabdium butyrativorans]